MALCLKLYYHRCAPHSPTFIAIKQPLFAVYCTIPFKARIARANRACVQMCVTINIVGLARAGLVWGEGGSDGPLIGCSAYWPRNFTACQIRIGFCICGLGRCICVCVCVCAAAEANRTNNIAAKVGAQPEMSVHSHIHKLEHTIGEGRMG